MGYEGKYHLTQAIKRTLQTQSSLWHQGYPGKSKRENKKFGGLSLKYDKKCEVIQDIWLSDPHITPQCKSLCLVGLPRKQLLWVDHHISLVILTGSSSNGFPLSIPKRRD